MAFEMYELQMNPRYELDTESDKNWSEMKTGNKGGSAEESYEEETWVSLDIFVQGGMWGK